MSDTTPNPNSAAVPTGAELIAAERQRQLDAEDWKPEHDDGHFDGELVSAARAYTEHALMLYAPANPSAAPNSDPPIYPYWPWHPDYYKPDITDGGIHDLVRAGALIAAEIDRLQRRGPWSGIGSWSGPKS